MMTLKNDMKQSIPHLVIMRESDGPAVKRIKLAIEQMVKYNPKDRITAKQVVETLSTSTKKVMMTTAPTKGTITVGGYEIDLKEEMKGCFPETYKGIHKDKKTAVAVKKMPITGGLNGLHEIRRLGKVKHHNVVQMFDVHYDSDAHWMMMEFCDLGDLNKYVKNKDPNMETKLRFMLQTAEAIRHMHGQEYPIVHRDIKPANILVTNHGGVPIVKLSDFGVSKMVSSGELKNAAMFPTAACAYGFLAPEIWDKKPYDQSVDVFALGLVCLVLLQAKKGKDLIPYCGKLC